MKLRYLSLVLMAVVALVPASVALMAYLAPDRAASVDSVSAVYRRGALQVSIPAANGRIGTGNLAMEILDPDDHVVEKIERHVSAGPNAAAWREEMTLPKTLGIEDLAWHRLRYAFTYDNDKTPTLHEIQSISRILQHPVVRVMGQRAYMSGAPAAVRLIVSGPENSVVSGGTVQVQLRAKDQPSRTLYEGKLDQRGTTQAEFRFPAGAVGNYMLHYAVDTAIGAGEYEENIQVEDKVSILLTTEKPVYQPNQTIHVRALALDRANHQAAANRALTFEVEDSRGNKVFKKATQTDAYGIASAEFALADEVNLGTYHLRALMQEAGDAHGNTAEAALQVERYVLPKFKVAVDLAQDGAAKHGYRPGDHVRGTVRANYFFGKAIDGAPVSVKASGSDVAVFEAGAAQGATDKDGAYHFDIRLPSYFAGHPLNQGAAHVLIEATVKDGAGHSETHGEAVTVSASPVLVTVVPEGGTLAPGFDNQLFVLTSYADGAPAQTTVKISGEGNAEQTATTDAGGVAVVKWHAGAGKTTVQVEAADHSGNRASAAIPLEARTGADQVLLRTDRAIYRSGDRIAMQVFSTKRTGAVYVDVVKDGQTVTTRDLDLMNGRAELSFAATHEMTGTVEFHAYQFGQDARAVGDHRMVFVQPADELKIETTSDAAAYKPGSEAKIGFHVTNGRGEGVQAALGLQIVDQAVFALAEKQPGFAKVFFYLEQEAMKPRYEIHSLGMPDILTDVAVPDMEQKERAARALFSATELVRPNNVDTEFGRGVPSQKYAEYAARYADRFEAQMSQLVETVTPDSTPSTRACDAGVLSSRLDKAPDAMLTDAWGNRVRIEKTGWNRSALMARSAGPDGQINTGDDLTRWVAAPGCGPGAPSAVDVKVEHERGPFNGLAEISGGVRDSSGAAVHGALILLEHVGSETRTQRSGANGGFHFAGLSAGDYKVRVTATGFTSASHAVRLEARDRAAVSATLNVGATNMVTEIRAMAGVAVGGMRARPAMFDKAMPMMAEAMPMMAEAMQPVMMPVAAPASRGGGGGGQPKPAETHVRSWFPESLYVAPEIITDGHGRASITVPIADSITTWRMAMMASTTQGALGSATASMKVFQDFFADLDLPVTLTQGDQVSIPVAVYNYAGGRGDVHLELKPEGWFTASDGLEKSLAVDAGRVGGAQFTIEAKRIGKFKLTLSARMDGADKRADIVVREIEVVPNGREQTMAFNGRLDSSARQQVNFPAEAIPDASAILVRLYPGPLSQVIEGMDSILRMPFGCFEQTSSATYPNVLALDYMKRTKKLTPEVHAKAEGFISTGYQRLLTFEVPGGGFSWFGNPPANKILTAYGLMEFGDMSKVYDVDPKLIQRTQQWLAAQQQADGSWKPDSNFINEGATNRYNSDALRITAYVAWSLENTGFAGDAVEKAKRFIESKLNGGNPVKDAYTLALVANFAADYKQDRGFIDRTQRSLLDAHEEKDDQAWWSAEETNVFSTGASAKVETTGLAVQALLKTGANSTVITKAINFITGKKNANGAWDNTQATVMALRAILLASEKGGATAKGNVEITLNGKPAGRLTLTAENNDLLHQFVLKNVAEQGANTVEIKFSGEGGLAYQTAGRYFVPWNEKSANEPLSIAVNYDRTKLAQDDLVTATANVRNNLNQTANMVMVDLGIPPGFDLLTEDLQSYIEKSAGKKSGRLEKFTLTATQAILYFDSIGARDGFQLTFRLRAKYPIRAKTFASRVYEYYSPDVNAVARPAEFEVKKR
ncbi:MAG TPA: MG2 domain-containing protein [Bryobacteraceae bacterium]|nr:MG2 domain-containing protein [Bryobacteraceae bacterium]